MEIITIITIHLTTINQVRFLHFKIVNVSASSGIGSVISFLVVTFILYQIVVACCLRPQYANIFLVPNSIRPTPNPNNNNGGWGGGYPGGGNPPPGDGYGPGGYPKTSYTGYSPSYVPPPAPAPGGFWTGFGTGGLLGYLFSRPSNFIE